MEIKTTSLIQSKTKVYMSQLFVLTIFTTIAALLTGNISTWAYVIWYTIISIQILSWGLLAYVTTGYKLATLKERTLELLAILHVRMNGPNKHEYNRALGCEALILVFLIYCSIIFNSYELLFAFIGHCIRFLLFIITRVNLMSHMRITSAFVDVETDVKKEEGIENNDSK